MVILNDIHYDLTSVSLTPLRGIDGPEDIKAYEYSVLVTDLEDDLVSLFYHYRDWADCENNFDEMHPQGIAKNQWGWGGYTTKDIKSCQFMSRMIALIYNWWNYAGFYIIAGLTAVFRFNINAVSA